MGVRSPPPPPTSHTSLPAREHHIKFKNKEVAFCLVHLHTPWLADLILSLGNHKNHILVKKQNSSAANNTRIWTSAIPINRSILHLIAPKPIFKIPHGLHRDLSSRGFPPEKHFLSIFLPFEVNLPSQIRVAARSKACLRPLAYWGCGFESRCGHWCLSLVSVVCCQVEVSASGWLLVQRSPTDWGVSVCDLETSPMWRPWPTRDCRAIKRSNIDT